MEIVFGLRVIQSVYMVYICMSLGTYKGGTSVWVEGHTVRIYGVHLYIVRDIWRLYGCLG